MLTGICRYLDELHASSWIARLWTRLQKRNVVTKQHHISEYSWYVASITKAKGFLQARTDVVRMATVRRCAVSYGVHQLPGDV